MSVSLAFELRSIRGKLVRLLEVYQSINQVQVPVSEWYNEIGAPNVSQCA
jgi:hypothetical protein